MATENLSIILQGLTKRFGDLTAVDNISLEVREGEFFGFLGPNGAGKSTTIKMLCGLIRPDGGRAIVAGYDVRKSPLEVKRRIGVLLEEPALYERLTGEEFILFAGQMYGIPRTEAKARTEKLLQLMELTEAKDRLIVGYSQGMKKKVALASALIHSPKVLFLDEPFGGIDAVSVHAIRAILDGLRQKGTTIFFCTHIMEVAERLCSRVAIINNGKLVGVGSIDELRKISSAGKDASLEEVFLRLVKAHEEQKPTLEWI